MEEYYGIILSYYGNILQDMSAVSPSPVARRKTKVLCRRRGGGGKPPPTCDTNPWSSPYKIRIPQISGFVSLEEKGHAPPPATQNHGFVSQTKLWSQIHVLLRHESLILHLDTCLTQEAQNWRDLNCSQ